ncbi:hypothetical protein BD414DRAFT_481741 [Trametes punicea]|nr:hypothetical protein BD414DRAFT_481741 [Trametes punicea]
MRCSVTYVIFAFRYCAAQHSLYGSKSCTTVYLSGSRLFSIWMSPSLRGRRSFTVQHRSSSHSCLPTYVLYVTSLDTRYDLPLCSSLRCAPNLTESGR